MSVTNYSGMTTPFGVHTAGHAFLTEVAREIQQIQVMDPTRIFLPLRSIPERELRVEQRDGDLRLVGIVKAGQPNKLDTFPTARSFTATPALFRRGAYWDMELINHLRKVGTDSEVWGLEQVREKLGELLNGIELMFSKMRAQLLTGGINILDQETGNSVLADSGIPTGNLYTVGSGALSGSAVWSDITNAKPVDDMRELQYLMMLEGRNNVTDMVMARPMLELLSRNKQVLEYLPGTDTGLHNLGLVSFGAGGLLTSLCGVRIHVHEMLHDDYVSANTIGRRYIWPVNKIVFLSASHPGIPGQALGSTVMTLGEHPQGKPGVYVRSGASRMDDLDDPTLAAGLKVQVGCAGIPILYKPSWVHVLTACTVNNIETALSTKYISAN